MYYKPVIIHKNRIFRYFQNKSKKFKYNYYYYYYYYYHYYHYYYYYYYYYDDDDNNKVIPSQIIQYFWKLTPLPLRFCPPLHHLQIMPK